MIENAFSWVDDQQPTMISELIELANQNSGSNHYAGLLAVADWLENWFGVPGVQFQRIELPDHKVLIDDGQTVHHTVAPALRWDYRPEASQRVLLAIHYDTVFGANDRFQTCQWIDDDRLQGPGVADAKGGIVVLRYALMALSRFGLAPDLGWTVVLNPDEELGSPSSNTLWKQIAPEFDFGLLFEPALPTGQLVAERKGSGNYDVLVRGRSAHAGRHFDEGRNAVALVCELMNSLHQLNTVRPNTTINIGAVVGGGPVNVVPDLAVGRLNVRVGDQLDAEWFEQELNRLVDQAQLQDGFEVELHGGILSPPKLLHPRSGAWMRGLESATEKIMGVAIDWTSTGGVCDGNKLAAAGLPNIDTLGPIGDGLHSANEWVQTSSLVPKTNILIDLLCQYASGQISTHRN